MFHFLQTLPLFPSNSPFDFLSQCKYHVVYYHPHDSMSTLALTPIAQISCLSFPFLFSSSLRQTRSTPLIAASALAKLSFILPLIGPSVTFPFHSIPSR